jgi:HD superfamily phosphohydrolase YqeK
MRTQALKMHEMARREPDEIRAHLLRAYGYVIATAHVKEHAIHATECANKALKAAKISDEEIEKIIANQNTALEELTRFTVSVDNLTINS